MATSDILSSWRLNEARCPHCNKLVDAATKAFGEKGGPAPGSLVICIGCLEVNQYEDNGNGGLKIIKFDLKELDTEERKDIEKLVRFLASRRSN